MKLTILGNSPLRPLAARARALSQGAQELWVATAFASEAAVESVVGVALKSGSKVRFLTGTFGNTTRLKTFRRVYRLAQTGRLQARIWDGDFHAKLLLWRKRDQGVAWIGSANLTDRGLQAEGELVAELRASWDSAPMRKLKDGFRAEWDRSDALGEAFLRGYEESRRPADLLRGGWRSPRARIRRDRKAKHGVMLVATVDYHYADASAAAERIGALLDGAARSWYRSRSRRLRLARPGDLCLLLDAVDGTACVTRINDRARDGRASVIAYEPFSTKADPRLTESVRRSLTRVGLRRTRKAFRSQWLPETSAAAIIEVLYGARLRAKFERLFSPR